ncbi:unnamed protein product, partial [Ectocarpus fasciculatus]
QSALFDFPSLLTVILLLICAATHARNLYPSIFNDANGTRKHDGLFGLCWKASRIGERLSPYIGGACVIMALHLLFFK